MRRPKMTKGTAGSAGRAAAGERLPDAPASDHPLRANLTVELLSAEQAQPQHGLPQRQVFLIGQPRGPRRVLIADAAVEARHQHQGVVQVLLHPRPVGHNAGEAALLKGIQGVAQQPDRVKIAADQHGHEHVQLEIALRGRHSHRRVVGHDLYGHHGHGLALGGIDLAGHDGGAGLVFGDPNLPDAAAGPAGQPAHVVGHLHHIRRQRLQRPVGKHQIVLRRQGVELVGIRAEGQAGELRHLRRHRGIEAGGRVDARAHRRAAQRQLIQAAAGALELPANRLKHSAPAGDLLREADGRGILQMGAPDLDAVPVGLLQTEAGCDHVVQSRKQPPAQLLHRGNVHGRGKRVVGTLGHIHGIVGVKQLLPRQRVAPVGDHLVDVHVGLGAAAGLPDGQGKFLVQLSRGDLVAHPRDQLRAALIQLAHPAVGPRRRFFQNGEGPDDLRRHPILPNGKILKAALRLRSPEPLPGNGHLSQRVMLHPYVHPVVLSFFTVCVRAAGAGRIVFFIIRQTKQKVKQKAFYKWQKRG